MTERSREDHGLLKVLHAPLLSEKATLLADKHSQVVFKIAPNTDKRKVKAAVELLFKVEVNTVQILNQKGKVKRSGRLAGRRKAIKKAYVCLKPGHEINFEAGA